jgi:hypothetical protein
LVRVDERYFVSLNSFSFLSRFPSRLTCELFPS